MKSPSYTDKMHAIAMVIDASTFDKSATEIEKMKESKKDFDEKGKK